MYLEAIKTHRSDADKAVSVAVLSRVLSDSLRLWHPIMPYVTEELWQHGVHNGLWKAAAVSRGEGEWTSLMEEAYPKGEAVTEAEATVERDMEVRAPLPS